jgi:hypothetical protein
MAHLIAGFANGPFGTGGVKDQETISVISGLGLIFMLIKIGLEIGLKKMVRAGKDVLFATEDCSLRDGDADRTSLRAVLRHLSYRCRPVGKRWICTAGALTSPQPGEARDRLVCLPALSRPAD